MNGPAPPARSACKGQLQRLLQGVKLAAGSAGENLCVRFGFVTERKEVPGRVAEDERASTVQEAKVRGCLGGGGLPEASCPVLLAQL